MVAVPPAATSSWAGCDVVLTGGSRLNEPPPVPTDAAQLDGPMGNVRLKKFMPTVQLVRWQRPLPPISTLPRLKVPVALTVQAPVKMISALAGGAEETRTGTTRRSRPRTARTNRMGATSARASGGPGGAAVCGASESAAGGEGGRGQQPAIRKDHQGGDAPVEGGISTGREPGAPAVGGTEQPAACRMVGRIVGRPGGEIE